MASGGNIADITKRVRKPVRAPDMTQEEFEGDGFDKIVMPAGCPVTPLGIQGLKLWVLDASNQLIPMATDCRKGDMTLLFGGDAWLMKQWPRYPKPSKDNPNPSPIGFDQAEAQTALVTACQRKGIFNPQGRVFGRGAHRAAEDEQQLVLHMGRAVLIAGQQDKHGKRGQLVEHRPGAIEESFFPALPALAPPAPVPSAGKDAERLRELFGEWFWVEADAAPLLLLGMVGQMFFCGALKWRSHVWLAGPTSAGKSSLQALIRALLGNWCLHVEDASEAAVRQILGDDTLPVMIDEAEADDNPEKQRAIINLAKKASSGAKIIRGGADHKGQEFTAQSCFLFSSVLHSLAKGEERNRVAILEMRQVPVTKKEYVAPDMAEWREIGRRMHRRMIEQWPRFNRTLADYKREIWSHGLEGRWQDTYGTLLACADCLLFDTAPSAESELNPEHGREKDWVLSILPMMKRGKSEARSDVERCIAHLMSSLLPGAHGASPETVAQWIQRAMRINDNPEGGINHTARTRLKQYGLRLVTLTEDNKLDGEPIPDHWNQTYLAVAYPTCEPLATLFRGKEWANGAYLQSLGKIEGVRKGLKMRFSGMNADNAIGVPLSALRDEE
jgi:hypothetical protein